MDESLSVSVAICVEVIDLDILSVRVTCLCFEVCFVVVKNGV